MSQTNNLSMMSAILNTSTPKVIAKSGTYVCRLIKFYNLGLHTNEFKGEIKPDKYKIYVSFEIQKQKHIFAKDKGEQMLSINKTLFLTLVDPSKMQKYPSPFSKMLLALGGQEEYQKLYSQIVLEAGEDDSIINRLLNQYIKKYDTCMIVIAQSTSTANNEVYANISDFVQIPDGMPIDKREDSLSIFDWSSNINTFYTLPDWIKKILKESKNWQLGNYKIKEEEQVEDKLPPINIDELDVKTPF